MGTFSFLDLLTILMRKKAIILAHFLSITAVAVLVAFVIPKKYKATALFLPPKDETRSFSPLALEFSLNLGGQSDFTPYQIESLLDSRTVLEAVVRRFDLMKIYKTEKAENNLEKAIKILRQNTKLKVEAQSGLGQQIVVHYALSVIDQDRQRSADIANAMVETLNETMERLSRRHDSYTVQFIKSRLDSVKVAKDSVQGVMAEFQKQHKIYTPDMKEQILASVSVFTELKRQKIFSEMERDFLLLDRGKEHRDVKLANQKIADLEREMRKLESGKRADVLPALTSSVDVAYQYMTMYQEYEIQVKLEVLLRQQYEEARIKNSRKVAAVRVVDPAAPPQWKNSPKKAVVVLILVGMYMGGLLLYILAGAGLEHASESTRAKINNLKSAIRGRSSASA